MLRRAVPYALVPLWLVACALASSPWLRAFPSSVVSLPLYGAVALSVLLPVVIVSIGVRRLWMTIALDVIAFAFYTMLVGLHELNGYADLYRGIVHGPAQILSYALPLISPRTLMVAPIALAWLCGAVVGECLARGWQSIVPYATVIATFGLAYGGSARAISSTSDGRRYDTLLAGLLLLTMLLLRAAHSWVAQDATSDPSEPGGGLPLRGLATAGAVAVVLAVLAAAVVQLDVFRGDPRALARNAPLRRDSPVDPIALIAGLRPADQSSRGSQLFSLGVDRSTSNFVAIAGADTYDGDTWSFGDRTFIPSGGVIPADEDALLHPSDEPVMQIYTINKGGLTDSPWMPFQYRPERVAGRSVDIDPASGMVVPTRQLQAGSRYTVTSSTARASFDRLSATAVVSSSAPASDTQLAPSLNSLNSIVQALENETGVSRTDPVRFLQAVTTDLRTHYRLAVGTDRLGSTGFADVLASILGTRRAGSPEQYATLIALVARQLGVPARLVTGFRIPLPNGETSLPAATYSVRTADAWTWVEIPVVGRGWVTLDATPARLAATVGPSSSTVQPTQTPTSSPTPNDLETSAGGPAVGTTRPTPGANAGSSSLWALLIVAAVVLVLVLAFLLLRKPLRARRRRRTGDPRTRLLGAWQDSLDLLSESGLPDLDGLTSAEIVQATVDRYDEETVEQTRFLGERANVAIFDPRAQIGPDDADAAWRAHRVLHRGVRRHLTLRQRVGAELRYHRPFPRADDSPVSWAAAAARIEATGTSGARHRSQPRHGAHRGGWDGQRPGKRH